MNRDIQSLLELWSKFEPQRNSLAGRKHLAELVDIAIDVLLDDSKKDYHASTRQLINTWFMRLENWYDLACDQKPNDFQLHLLYFQNLQLFNEPDLGLISGLFENAAIIEAIHILKTKPETDWSSSDRKKINWLDEKLESISNNRRKSEES